MSKKAISVTAKTYERIKAAIAARTDIHGRAESIGVFVDRKIREALDREADARRPGGMP